VVPDATGKALGKLPTARSDLVAATVEGHTYVLGGFDGSKSATAVLQTDDGVNFTVIAQLPDAVRYPAMTVVGSTIYLFGGQVGTAQTADIQAVDVTARTARVVAKLPVAITEATAWVQGGAVYLAGGRQGTTVSSAIWRVEPGSGQVITVGALPAPAADAAVAVLGDVAYLFGGEGKGRLKSIVKVNAG
jgi:N-acetylneuraminic acid mutarotase